MGRMVGDEIERIFLLNWADYQKFFSIFADDWRRLITEAEHTRLNALATAAAALPTSIPISSVNPRLHVQMARRALTEFRSSRDRLYSVLEGTIALDTAVSAAKSQVEYLDKPEVAQRTQAHLSKLAEIKQRREKQRQNIRNAADSINKVRAKYQSDAFKGPAHDPSNPLYYEEYADDARLYDNYSQQESLYVADLYDDIAAKSLSAEAIREELEREQALLNQDSLGERQFLLKIDYTSRIIDALTDVLQNAAEVARTVATLLVLQRIEGPLPPDDASPVKGWYFANAHLMWPAWVGRSRITAELMISGDEALAYMDRVDAELSVIEDRLHFFDFHGARSLFKTRLAFTKAKTGLVATLTVPTMYRYQEVSAIYIKGVPAGVSSLSVRGKMVTGVFSVDKTNTVVCTPTVPDKEADIAFFGSDGALAAASETFSLERECLICSSSGNQPLTLNCDAKIDAGFAVDCIFRVIGTNDVVR